MEWFAAERPQLVADRPQYLDQNGNAIAVLPDIVIAVGPEGFTARVMLRVGSNAFAWRTAESLTSHGVAALLEALVVNPEEAFRLMFNYFPPKGGAVRPTIDPTATISLESLGL